MNRINIFLISLISLFIVSCDLKEEYENEMSSVVDVAGEWFVLYNHETYGEDPFEYGFTQLLTFNTSDDDGSEIWLSDEGNFWDYKHKIPVNSETMTFGSDEFYFNNLDPIYDEVNTDSIIGYDSVFVSIQNGRIFEEVSLQPSGTLADSIFFEVYITGLTPYTGIENDKMLVSGFRRTGFLEDEH